MNVMEQIGNMGHEQVIFCHDQQIGLKAIIAIHDTTLGPALGGCRFWNYSSEEEALFDVLRLSRGMTYKAAMANLSLGGGKSVIIGDPNQLKSEALFRRFGRFVDGLGGRYITAEDVNVRVSDMNQVKMETNHVTGVSAHAGGSGDPSPLTALGVFHAIRAAVHFRLNKKSLEGVSVAIQGCGSVGRNLCALLAREKAKLYVSDLNASSVDYVATEFGATPVDIDEIHKTPCDVFAPCALGGILNPKSIPEISASIVAGGANNQLLDESRDGDLIQKHKILLVPDYVANGGGLINVAHELKGYDSQKAEKDVADIYKTVSHILEFASEKNIFTFEASNQIAEDRIRTAKQIEV